MRRICFVTLFLVLIACQTSAQSPLRLQEKCAEGAKKFFFDRIKSMGGQWGGFKNGEDIWKNEFVSHYNKKLDRCFIRIEWQHWRAPIDKYGWDYHIRIYDVFTGSWVCMYDSDIFGTGKGFYCLGGKASGNELSEFEALIKPFMEE